MNNPVRTHYLCPVAHRAHAILMRELKSFGNEVSLEHNLALYNLELAYSDTARRMNAGRVAWPMSVGGGKTESIAAYAAALAELGKSTSLLICQNTIEALCKLKRRMVELGVPSASIGLVHSKSYDPARVADAMDPEKPTTNYASEPSIDDDPADYRFLLVSHQMMKTREDIHEFNRYADDERDLVIWDESLLKSRGRTVDILQLRSALGAAAPYVEDAGNEDAAAALKFLRYCLDELDAELRDQREESRPARPLRLPEKNADVLQAWTEALAKSVRSSEVVDHLRDFLSITQETLRVVKVARGAVIHYDLLIPTSLKRIVVLDASYNIRELVSTFDREIAVVDAYAGVKDFGDVQVNQLWHGGGRSSIDPALRATSSPLLKAIVERVKTYDPDRGVIIFTYKTKPGEERRGMRSHADLIKRALVRAGVDIDATLPCGRPRFVWLTWGQELGLSNFSHCEYVMHVGIYRPSRHSLALSIAGQLDDLTAPEAGDSQVVRLVELSEVFHALYQAAGRGNCRRTYMGRAGRMQLDWVGMETFPAHYWADTLPNVQLGRWESKHVVDTRQIADGAQAIVEHLMDLPDEVDYVSSRALKPAVGLKSMHKSTFKLVRERAEKELEDWQYENARQGFVRYSVS